MSDNFIFTSDSVTAGHPDKVCDQVSDAIVDHYLMHDRHSRIVAECAVSSGVMFISTHFASKAILDIPAIARRIIRDVGYPDEVFDADACAVLTSFTDHTAADYRPLVLEEMTEAEIDEVTAKHQVSLFGYACDQTSALLPLPIWLAHRLAHRLDSPEMGEQLPYLLTDGKTQVGIEYKKGKPSRVHSITLVASQTDAEAADLKQLRADLIQHVIEPVLTETECQPDKKTQMFVNPEGLLIGGGPAAHSGLTGRKTGIDTYGEYARHSGAALSGKDPLRIDRVGAYAARYAARNVVAAGLARECEVQLSYSVGLAGPVSVRVRTFGTGEKDESELAGRLLEVFDFRLGGIVRDLGLQKLPTENRGGFYRKLAVYGHMGRTAFDVPWEREDKADALK
ncbi:MAG: methionine adenosyltransferase [Pseudomonadota bacterium]